MNKTAIKNFAVWARKKLISEITYKAGLLGITEKGVADALPQSTKDLQFFNIGTKDYTQISKNEISQRNALVSHINEKAKSSDYKTAFQSVVEEVAYTWFNRLIAVRFMEVNDYLPSRIRVLSSESPAKSEPDFVTIPFDTDLEFSAYERDRVMQLKDENKLDELFRMLFIKQCNKLNETLPELFEKTDDYTELLLNISFTDKEGVLYHLAHDIDEDDFKEAVEIIGWMYQYYNEDRKNEVINIYKGIVKKEDIPAATQLFTTDWVVRYMVDNSLGKYWVERNPNSKLRDKLTYFIGDNTIAVDEKISPEDLKILDPCMGSGHILVYAFDVLIMIYEESGYSKIDAVRLILQKNIYGLDIDDRAYQLAYFAVMMRARSYSRRILVENISPNLCAIQESGDLKSFDQGIGQRRLDEQYKETANYLIQVFKNAKEYGSLIEIENRDYEDLFNYIEKLEKEGTDNLDIYSWYCNISKVMPNLIKQATVLSQLYDVVVTNPPYLNKMDGGLKDYVNQNYKDYSGDLFSVFMYRNFAFCKPNGYSAFMTPFVWMFIKTYEKLREYIITNKNISSLIQMEYSAFEEATVPICTFVIKNAKGSQKGNYIKLSEFKGGMEVQKQKVLEAISDNNCNYLFHTSDENFTKIPGMPIAYWVSEKFANVFERYPLLAVVAKPKKGLDTADNDRFVRNWSEVSITKSYFYAGDRVEAKNSFKTWFPLNSGGNFRKWYGNFEKVINWENDGYELSNFKHAYIRAKDSYFMQGISWTKISSSKLGVRFAPKGFIFDSAGQSLFPKESEIYYILAILCSKFAFDALKMLNPTLNYQVGDFDRLPINIQTSLLDQVNTMSKQCVLLSKSDWDSFETSWGFENHPLI